MILLNRRSGEEKLLCQRASDNKGELISRLVLVKYFQANGGLPVNVKFLLKVKKRSAVYMSNRSLRKTKAKLAADACIWEGGKQKLRRQLSNRRWYAGITVFDVGNDNS